MMLENPETPVASVTAREVGTVLRLRWFTIALAVLLGAGVAAAASTYRTPTYSATAVVTLSSITDNPLSTGTPRTVNGATEAEVARSTEVVTEAAARLGHPSVGAELARRLTTTVPANSQALSVTVTDSSARGAAAAANAVAGAYLDIRTGIARRQVDTALAQLDAQIGQLADRQRVVTGTTVDPKVSRADAVAAAAEAEVLSGTLTDLRRQRSQVLATPVVAGNLIGPAGVPAAPAGPSFVLLVLAGAFAGLLAGLLGALVRNRFDHRLYTVDQVRAVTGAPVLVEVGGGAAADTAGFDRLAGVVAARFRPRPVGPVVVIGRGNTGFSEVSARTAAALSRYYAPAVLACPSPVVAETVAAIEADVTGPEGVRVLGFGVAEDPHEIQGTVEDAGADLVVADAVHLGRRGAAMSLTGAASGVVVCVWLGRTTSGDLREQLADLRATGAEVMGVVAVRASRPLKEKVTTVFGVPSAGSRWMARELSTVESRIGSPSRLLMVCSSGGHLAQLHMLHDWWSRYDTHWVTFDCPQARELLQGRSASWAYHPTTRNIPNLIRNFLLAVRVLREQKPDVVVSTGAGVAWPFMVLARLFGARTAYLEVYDRISSKTLTGRLCRPFTDLFMVQWPEQERLYPGSVVVGTVF
ncbi:PssD/Cps14F family polysaccharide biosynthesis glycosyltransferase [Amycolatopsis sp. GM8]|uniref:PssD/Cps14F family polysaccharide biosynthesis glycosyltransferase n=1 Tax=Amycolatopsis sp. GM8 TaxID=2896530 RepID=UPI001F33D7AA|nr:PssD/Cps14F family polysaccharide biosynthesis glycosyltransferase [Amycolatopsis sp. GM8]